MFDIEKKKEAEGRSFPGKSFARNILEPIFNTQRDFLLKHFIQMTKAHVVMLRKQDILSEKETNEILRGILKVETIDLSDAVYKPEFEDMFFMFENALEQELGKDLAGRVHIARSRNDICIAEFRMVLRDEIVGLMTYFHEFRKTLLYVIGQHQETIMPAYTHTQPAQPTTLGHYFLSFYDSTSRQMKRLIGLEKVVNRSPLGAVAITTTGFKISRQIVSDMLGFHGVIENAYDAIAGNDHYLECAGTLMNISVELSKFLKDILDLCTNEFKGFYLSDAHVQKSSIMPQKRNPSSLEHCRPLVGLAMAEAQAIFTVLHNTPYGDIVDGEEDLQPHIYKSFDYLKKVLDVMTNVLASMKVNKDVLSKRAEHGFITVTELADTLVRDFDLPFRKAHHLTSKIVHYLIDNDLQASDISSEIVSKFSDEVLGFDLDMTTERLREVLSAQHFISIRSVYGGPALSEVKRMFEDRCEAISDEAFDIEGLKDLYLGVDHILSEEINKLINN